MSGSRSWWERKPPHWKRAVGWLTLAYVIMVAVTFFGPRFLTEASDAWSDFFVAMWANIAFFSVLGLATFFIGLKRPQDEAMQSRLWYLFCANEVTEKALEYSKKQVNKLASFCPQGTMTVTFLECDQEHDACELEIRGDMVLQNMYHDRPYSDPEFRAVVGPDPVPNKAVLGEITTIRTHENGKQAKDHIESAIRITAAQPGKLVRNFLVEIPANGNVRYEFRYTLWCSRSEGYSMKLNRYTENLLIVVKNQTDVSFVVACYPLRGNGLNTEPVIKIPKRENVIPSRNVATLADLETGESCKFVWNLGQ